MRGGLHHFELRVCVSSSQFLFLGQDSHHTSKKMAILGKKVKVMFEFIWMNVKTRDTSSLS